MNYDLLVSDAKRAATLAVCRLVREPDNGDAQQDVAHAIDELNKAWDQLTGALVRQRDERDRQISRLLDELAEAGGRVVTRTITPDLRDVLLLCERLYRHGRRLGLFAEKAAPEAIVRTTIDTVAILAETLAAKAARLSPETCTEEET